MGSIIESLDSKIAEFLSQWDVYTVIIGLALTAFVTHTLMSSVEPDIHPFILARQSYADRVRNPGESAVYRSPDVHTGGGLRTGLDVKLKEDKPYTAGRDGDLRYIWATVTGDVQRPVARGIKPVERLSA